jgi:hypothetical protein
LIGVYDEDDFVMTHTHSLWIKATRASMAAIRNRANRCGK